MSDPDRLVKYGDKIFMEKQFLYADSTFFKVFSFPLLRGDRNRCCNRQKWWCISQSTAKKYFGNDDPLGKILLVSSNEDSYTVTGVAADCPSNSQIKFDFLASFSSLGQHRKKLISTQTLPLISCLKIRTSIASLQAKIGPFMKKEMSGDRDAYVNYQLEPFTNVASIFAL